jgi:hypothetical protein
MISSTQREALEVLGELCAMSDDIRLGQLLAHLGYVGEINTSRTLWNIDDEQLLAVMYQHRAELAARTPDPNAQPSTSAIIGVGPTAVPTAPGMGQATPGRSGTP